MDKLAGLCRQPQPLRPGPGPRPPTHLLEQAPDSHTEPPCSALPPGASPAGSWHGWAGPQPAPGLLGSGVKGRKASRVPAQLSWGLLPCPSWELPSQRCCLSWPRPCHPGDQRLETGVCGMAAPVEAARGRPRDFTQVPAPVEPANLEGPPVSLAAPADGDLGPGACQGWGGNCPYGQQARVHLRPQGPSLPGPVQGCWRPGGRGRFLAREPGLRPRRRLGPSRGPG